MMKKTKKQPSFVLNILTARPHSLLMNCIFKCIYLLMTNKLKSSQLKYLYFNEKYTKKQTA